MNGEFIPCHRLCPAVTGKPHGSVRYCPMQEKERHQRHMKLYNSKDNTWNAEEYIEHPDYTDCCLDFQCCIDEIENPEYKEFLQALTNTHRKQEYLNSKN